MTRAAWYHLFAGRSGDALFRHLEASPSTVLAKIDRRRVVRSWRPNTAGSTLEVSDHSAGHPGLSQNFQIVGNADVTKLKQCVVHPAETQDIGQSSPRFRIVSPSHYVTRNQQVSISDVTKRATVVVACRPAEPARSVRSLRAAPCQLAELFPTH